MMSSSGFEGIQEIQGTAQNVESKITTYAIFGSTGNCGTEIIRQLLQMPSVKINAYCRNKNKLTSLVPEVIDSKKVEIFEGSLHDLDLLARCSKDCRTIFLLASTNDNIPGCRISQDLAQGVVKALQQLKAGSIDFIAPKLVLLSSATIDDHLSRKIPYFRPIMLRAASNIYEDLRVTERFLRTHEDWLSTIYMKPGGLSVDIQRGHKLSLDDEETFLSYADLVAGMLEAANDPSDQWIGKNLSVINANEKAKFAPGTPKCILFGLIRHYMPFLHAYLPSTGPV